MDVISFISKSKEFADGEINEKGYGSFQPYCVHGPNVHTYLQEMNQKVLSRYPIMTVGETSGVTVEKAIRYAGEEGKELNMVFQFEHMDLDGGGTFKWNDSKNAGFTTGNPWIMVNPNYKEINAEKQIKEKDSVFSYYKKLIQIRHEEEIVVYGSYELIDEKHPYLYAYKRTYHNRTLLVICNFSEKTILYEKVADFVQKGGIVICTNYPDNEACKSSKVRPYEAIVLSK